MNNKFDELAKGLAQSVTRRGALKKFGVGLAGMVLATVGFAKNGNGRGRCKFVGAYCPDCCNPRAACGAIYNDPAAIDWCVGQCAANCRPR